ncbi:MAG TPA: glycosyl hydrolase-related protein [Bacteroidales bacterium]|nr:glycosyl hydrolase-related protein [Bacteroidales bacterium]
MKRYLITCSSTVFIFIFFLNLPETFAQFSPPSGDKKKGDYSYFKGGTISVIPSSHQDIAWMDSIGACIEFRDKMMITPVLKRLRENPGFKFSVEDALSLREYLTRHPDSRSEILKYTSEGRLEWGATYKQPYESMYDGESLIRQAYLGRKWLKKTLPGCDFKTYWNEDVPGRSLQMAQILSKSGIPYMQFSRHQPGIYRWYSPDGSYITCFTPGQYDEVGIPVRQAHSDINQLTKAYTSMLFEWNNYFKTRKLNPEFPFIYSHDFATPPDYDAFFNDWNKKSVSLGKPAIKYATGTEYLEAVSKGNQDFDIIEGERPDVWLYIHGPSHQRALKASREGSRLLTAAEKFATFDALQKGSFADYPQYELTRAWENAIYPDHGWGGKHGDLTDRAFRTAYETGREIASSVFEKSMKNIASRINFSGKGIPVTVFNPLSWDRTDIVKFTMDVEGNDDNTFRLIDEKGNEIAYQIIDDHEITGNRDEVITFLFVAKDVPSVGYRTYYLEKSEPSAFKNNSKAGLSAFENDYFKVEFADGGLKSIFDKALSVGLLNTAKFLGAELFTMQSVGNGAGEFTDVQQPTMEGFEKMSQYKQPWSLISSGPVRDVYEFRKEISHVTVVEQVIFYSELKRIDFRIGLLGFDGERYREFRLAFPLNQATSDVAYEVPMGVVRIGRDEMVGAAGFSKTSQIYSTPCAQVHPREVQDWFSAFDGKNSVTISSDVAVFDWIDPTENPARYTILQPLLLASRKSCHGEGNFYLQPGDHFYSFSLYSNTYDWRGGYRQAIQSNQPMKAIVTDPSRKNGSMPEMMSFVSVENKNLILSAIKKCEDDDNVIVRCYDIEGIDSEAKIRVPFSFKKAELTNMIEEEGKEIPGSGDNLSLNVGHHSIETIKLFMK